MEPMDKPTQPCPAPAAPAPTPDLTGRTLAEFRVVRRLGSGGMGEVYLAEQLSLGRMVALKVLRPDLITAQPEAMRRFQAEAKAVARATHANIVQVYAIGEADGLWFMALEYVEGRNLKEYLTRKGPPELLIVLSIMRQVAAALQRAGELGIVHRDIKPENILLTRKGEVKVADFGLARCLAGEAPLHLTQSGVTMGTPLYMSPEQAEGKPIDHRTDIYSFGVTCYHMLAGHPPFRGENPFEVALQHVRAEPEPLARLRPDLPEGLCGIVHKMMAKDPAGRYQTARDLLLDVLRLREGLSGQTAFVQAMSLALEIPASASGSATSVPPTGSAPGATTVAAPLTAARVQGWLRRAALVAGTLLLAGGLGVTCGWLGRRTGGPVHPAAVPLPDEEVIEVRKKEETLAAAVDLHLRELSRPGANVQAGLDLSRELGLFYLQHGQLEEAERLFDRLAKLESGTGYTLYRALGNVGRGIVLALQNRPKDSNDIFRSLGRPAAAKGKPMDPWRWAPALRGDQELRYWLLRAVDYNRRNGISPSDMPLWLQHLLPARPSATP
jgi:serine/threonine-protein kinase